MTVARVHAARAALRRAALWLVAFGLVFACACRPKGPSVVPPPASDPTSKTLGPGDVVEIRVRDSEDLSGPYEVADDGTIRFPPIGDVDVRGKNSSQIAVAIEAGLADGWLRQPHVAVRVTERQNREVSVLGSVNTGGSYPFKPGLTLVQAISLAGGMNPLAQARKVKLIRQTDKGKQTFEVDVNAIVDSRADDIPLEPGDIVYVPESPV